MLAVENCEVNGQSREEASFDSSENQAANKQSRIILRYSSQSCDYAPNCCDEGDPAIRPELFKGQVGRNFSKWC